MTDRALPWLETLGLFFHRRVLTMLFLGFSAGVPLLLIFSSLSLWLREAGAERAAVTYFSWAALGYSFKFVWAPLVDQLPLPLLSHRLGRRRAWMLTAQLAIASAILLMASIDPQSSEASLTLMALAAVLLGFSSATPFTATGNSVSSCSSTGPTPVKPCATPAKRRFTPPW